MTQSIRENIVYQQFGIETEMYKKFAKNWDEARVVGNQMIADLKDKKENGQLNEYEEASYWNQAHNRRVEENSELTELEVDGLCYTMLTASVDTTAGKTAWHVLHTALNPDVQEQMYEEVKRIADDCGGVFTEDSFSTGNAPYLHGLLRESHRLTNRKKKKRGLWLV
jgi:cytochrome P450